MAVEHSTATQLCPTICSHLQMFVMQGPFLLVKVHNLNVLKLRTYCSGKNKADPEYISIEAYKTEMQRKKEQDIH